MRVSFITGVCARFDAISDVVRSNIEWLSQLPGTEVMLYSFRCDYPDLPHLNVGSSGEIATDWFFQSSDLVICNFGIFNELFGAVLAAPPRSEIWFRFHNVTPKELLPSWQHPMIDASLRQLSLMSFADRVLCDSAFNLAELRARGIDTPAIVRQISVEVPLLPPIGKPSFADDILRVLFIGRFVRSKGPKELIMALREALPELPQDRVDVDLVGNIEFSDGQYLDEVRSACRLLQRDSGGRVRVRPPGTVSDDERNELLIRADLFVLPTYHEGFCVPIIEALASGCDVVSYSNSNIPFITGGLATLVETGDKQALSVAIAERATVLSGNYWRAHGYLESAARSGEHVAQFSPDIVRQNFLTDVRSLAADASVPST
jgi:glycosyltransferase involved in cell wall biosynthesis